MSVHATAWAWEQATANPGQRLVLLAMADNAAGPDTDEPGICWPSIELIAAKCRLSTRQVKRHLADLHDAGLVVKMERRRRSDGSFSVWEYLVPYQGTSTAPGEATRGHPRSSPGDIHGTDQGTPMSPQEPSCEPSTEPSLATDTSEIEEVSVAQRLCELLSDTIQAWSNDKAPTVTKQWVDDMDRLIRIDGRDPDQIVRVIRWLYTSPDEVATFWAPNIQSPKKLRAKWVQMATQYARIPRKKQYRSDIQQDLDRIRERDAS